LFKGYGIRGCFFFLRDDDLIDFAIHLSKGKKVNIPLQALGYYYGDVNESGDVGRYSGKSFLFFLKGDLGVTAAPLKGC